MSDKQRRSVVSYSQAHLRLKRDRGRAALYLCIQCAAPAREWDYMGGCPNELIDERGAFSLDQTRYRPMCLPCHRRLDRAVADGRTPDVCPRGHLWDAENTGLRVKRAESTGLRYCKSCQRENTRRWRARTITAA